MSKSLCGAILEAVRIMFARCSFSSTAAFDITFVLTYTLSISLDVLSLIFEIVVFWCWFASGLYLDPKKSIELFFCFSFQKIMISFFSSLFFLGFWNEWLFLRRYKVHGWYRWHSGLWSISLSICESTKTSPDFAPKNGQ
jgi:hypothetical protein